MTEVTYSPFRRVYYLIIEGNAGKGLGREGRGGTNLICGVIPKQEGRNGGNSKGACQECPRGRFGKAAYYHWLKRGSPLGDPLTDWVATEEEGPSQRSWLKRMVRTKRESEPFIPNQEHA